MQMVLSLVRSLLVSRSGGKGLISFDFEGCIYLLVPRRNQCVGVCSLLKKKCGRAPCPRIPVMSPVSSPAARQPG